MATEKRLVNAHDLWSDIMMLPHNGDMISSEEVEQAIIKAPTVDAVEVVHGRWDDSGRYRFVGGEKAICCTKCGCALTEQEYKRLNWHYCPVCGRKMDEPKAEQDCRYNKDGHCMGQKMMPECDPKSCDRKNH